MKKTLILILTLLVVCWQRSYAADPETGSSTASVKSSSGEALQTLRMPALTSKVPLLTETERAWLREHPHIRIAYDPLWPPLEFADKQGEFSGIASEYLKLVEQKLGVQFVRVSRLNWQEICHQFKHHKIDMLTCVAATPERTAFMIFTKSYINIPIVIFSQADVTYISNMRELAGKKVAVVENYAVEDWVLRDFPDIHLVRVKNVREGLENLEQGKVYAYIDNMLTGSYYMAKLKTTNIKIVGNTPYMNSQAMAVRNDWPAFVGIIQKGLDSISEQERASIYQRWVNTPHEKEFDHALFWRWLAVLVGALGVLMVWNRRLSKEIQFRKQIEKALQEREIRYQTLVEHAPVAIYVNRNDRVTLVNNACLRLFGATRPEQLIGKSPYELFHPDCHQRVHDRIGILRDQGKPVPPREQKIVRLDGSVADVEVVAAPFPDQGVNAIHVALRDITEQKRAQEAIAESELKYRTLADSGQALIWTSGLDKKCNYFNQPWLAFTGRTLDQELGDGWTEGVHPADLQRCVGTYVNAFDCRQKFSMEYRLRHAGGAYRWIQDDGTPRFDNTGNFLGYIGHCLDISERKDAEEAVRESQKKYRELAENINDAIFTVDSNGYITYIGPSVLSFSGFGPEELIGRNFTGFVCEEDKECLIKSFRNTLEGRLEPQDFRYQTKDGKIKWARCSGRPIEENGKVIGTRGVLSDITLQKNMELELIKAHKLDSLGVLAGGIAHDFNNILTGIVGCISIVRNNLGTAHKAWKILFEAEKAALQSKGLFMQLLTFSEGGSPEKKPIALEKLVAEAVQFAVRGSNIGYVFHAEPDLYPVNADTGQMNQVIHNIVLNAVQSMPCGGDISVAVENTILNGQERVPLGEGKYVRIMVRDSGLGIPSENIGKIFDPYFTTRETGSGLGLAVSYSIIKCHDGYIAVDSAVGQGSTFSIYLPAYSGKVTAALPEENLEIRKGGGRILVLDDQLIIRSLMGQLSSILGYEVECVADGDQAVARYRETWGTPNAFDVVILDLTIPGRKGGKPTLDILKSINPQIKAIVSSGHSYNPVMVNCKEYGFSASLPKPYSIEKISEVLFALLPRATVKRDGDIHKQQDQGKVKNKAFKEGRTMAKRDPGDSVNDTTIC